MSDQETEFGERGHQLPPRRSSGRRRWFIAAVVIAAIATVWFWPGDLPDTSPLFADPQNACQEALNSPPLSNINDYLSGRISGEHSGLAFQNLFNRVLIETGCNIEEVRKYMDRHCHYVRERTTGRVHTIRYEYIRPDETLIRSATRIILGLTTGVNVVFDEGGNFINSGWGATAL